MKLSGSSFFMLTCLKSTHRALIAPVKRVRSCLEFPLGLVADFFAEDSCLLCGGSRDRAEPPAGSAGTGAGDAAAAAALTGPVTVTVCGARVRNHPVCPACARGFENARTAGILGTVASDGSVATVAGDVFGAASEELHSAGGSSPGRVRVIQVIAPYMTNDNVLQILHLAKYKGVVSLTEIMARSIARTTERFGIEFPANAVLVPVPLFAGERRRLDHTGRICSALASVLSLPVASGRLRKIRLTGSQSRTQRRDRAHNVRDAFSAAGFGDYHVFLVDDVVTSGATAGACSAALAAAGAQSITVLCFGRAL